jgi:hypothetical protein
MRRLYILGVAALCILAGCSSGAPGSAKTGAGGTSGDYVALNQTIFMGDNITQNWPLASNTPQENTTITIADGIASDFTQYASECVSGCSPSELQQAAPNSKRLVLLIGEFDALNLCGGVADTNFSYDLDTLVRAGQSLFGLEVWVGTVPAIYTPSSGTVTCQTETANINQQIAAVALADGAHVVDFAGVLTSSADANLATKYESPGGYSYLPSATGYTAMTNLYNQENQ